MKYPLFSNCYSFANIRISSCCLEYAICFFDQSFWICAWFWTVFSHCLWSIASCHLLAFLYSGILTRLRSNLSLIILSCFLTLHLCFNLNFGKLLTIFFQFTNFLWDYMQSAFRHMLNFVYFNVSFSSEIASCFLFTFSWSCFVLVYLVLFYCLLLFFSALSVIFLKQICSKPSQITSFLKYVLSYKE